MKEIKEQYREDEQSVWQYTIIWYARENPLFTKEDEARAIKECALGLSKEAGFELEEIEVTPQYIQMKMRSHTQINLGKVVKQFQKKLITFITNFIPYIKEQSPVFDEGQTIVISKGDADHLRNIRLEKILQTVIDAEYYDMENGFISNLEDLKNYILQQKLTILEQGDKVFLIDEEALKKEINLNCFACTKLYKYGCCCGSPCNLGSRNRKVFDKYLFNIEEQIKAHDERTYKKIMAKGGFMASDGSINECEGHCALLIEEEGVYKCMAHSYALKRDVPVYSLCPLSCLMYPLEMIELVTNKQRKLMLITSVVDEEFANHFGRWGSYNTLEVELRCINKEGHNDIFREEDYRPVYEVNQGLLCHEFGELFYTSLVEILKEL